MQSLSLKEKKKPASSLLTQSHLVFCQNGLAGRRRGDETAGAHDGVVGIGVVLDEPAPSHTHVACSDLHKRPTGR